MLIITRAVSQEAYDNLLQAFREADADLAGIYDRWDFNVKTNQAEADAALETKKHIGEIYKDLTGQEIGTHVPLT